MGKLQSSRALPQRHGRCFERDMHNLLRLSALRGIGIALALGSLGLLSGCYAEAVPAPEPMLTSASVQVDGYEPAYYDGYVVYYDDVGRPYYYDRGAVVWVSTSSPYYGGLVHHWRVYGPAYHRWYSNYGYRYRTYRAGPGYHAYHGYRAPPARRR